MIKTIKVLLSLLLALMLVACTAEPTPDPEQETPPTTDPAEPDEGETDDEPTGDMTDKKMGVVMPNATHGFTGESIKHAEASVKELAEEHGFEYSFLTSGESSEQNNQIDQLISEEVDVIVLWPHNGDELRSAAQKVMEAGIPLIIYDRLINEFTPTAEIMGDNDTIGEMSGEYFNKFFEAELAEGTVNILEFKGDNSTVPQQRSDGFMKTANENFEIVLSVSTDWQRAKAQEQMESFLNNSSTEEVESVKAVFTHDDEVVLGVLDAIKNYSGDAELDIRLVSGVGGRKENLETFDEWEAEGVMQVTYSFAPHMVREAVKLGVDVLNGEEPSGLILIDTEEIDNANYEEFMEGETWKIRYESGI